MTCVICLETYTKELRLKVTCPYCPSNACRGCVQRYLLTTYEDPHCLGCKRGWNREFIDLHLTKTFRNGPLRKHRAKVLMDREKAMLPAMQIFVEATKNIRSLREENSEVQKALRKKELVRIEILRGRDTLRRSLQDATNDKDRKKILADIGLNCDEYGRNEGHLMRIRFDNETIARNITRSQNILDGREENDNRATEVREFIQRCPGEDCRGYLSTAYKCGVCAKYACSDCLAIKGDSRDSEHTCNEEAKATAAMIRRETKPCPKCGVRIFKIDGCDQMFCTQSTCHTAFSWNTGRIVTGAIHNPHYYEYLRHRNGGEMPREAGDIPCGGLPLAWQFSREILLIPAAILSTEQKNLILSVHRCLTDMVDVRLPDYPARQAAAANKDINIHYLMNEMTEADWQKNLEQRETRFERKKEIGQILTTFAHVGAEFIRGMMNHPRVVGDARLRLIATTWNTTSAKQLEDLRLYTNKSLVDLGNRMCCAIPQIDSSWNYVPLRKKGLNEDAPAPAPAPAPVYGPAPAPATAPPRIQNQQPQNRFERGDYAEDDAVIVE